MENIDNLNRQFGAPGRIVFRQGHGGFPEVVLANKYGTAEIALLGGVVLSYRPTGGHPVLFRPKKRQYTRGEKIHAGITLCWPQFSNGAIEGVCHHGFAQFMPFCVRSTKYGEESTEITIGISSDDETMAVWPHKFDLEYTIVLSMKLNLSLKTVNTDDKPFGFTAAFHPYFLVRDIASVTVKGVDGCEYIDAGNMNVRVHEGDFSAANGSNHVFTLKDSPKHEFAILDPGLKRAIAIVGANHGVCTIWNPNTLDRMVDHEEDDYKSFICVEPCTAWRKPLTNLDPGESIELVAAIQSVQEEA